MAQFNVDYSESMATLARETQASIASVSARVDGLNSEVSRAHSRIGAMGAELSETRGQLTFQASRVDDVLGQLAALQAQQMRTAGQIKDMQAAQDASTATVAHATQRVEQVRQAVAAEVRNREETDVDPEYNGPPNGTLLRLHVNEEAVPKEAISQAVIGWLNGFIAEDQWRLDGPAEGQRFVLRFTSFPKTAALQIKKAMDILRPDKPDDPWTDIW
eukprot:12401726-Karenia_brevis.AAC.1